MFWIERHSLRHTEVTGLKRRFIIFQRDFDDLSNIGALDADSLARLFKHALKSLLLFFQPGQTLCRLIA